jgi:hypothetical protein
VHPGQGVDPRQILYRGQVLVRGTGDPLHPAPG